MYAARERCGCPERTGPRKFARRGQDPALQSNRKRAAIPQNCIASANLSGGLQAAPTAERELGISILDSQFPQGCTNRLSGAVFFFVQVFPGFPPGDFRRFICVFDHFPPFCTRFSTLSTEFSTLSPWKRRWIRWKTRCKRCKTYGFSGIFPFCQKFFTAGSSFGSMIPISP